MDAYDIYHQKLNDCKNEFITLKKNIIDTIRYKFYFKNKKEVQENNEKLLKYIEKLNDFLYKIELF